MWVNWQLQGNQNWVSSNCHFSSHFVNKSFLWTFARFNYCHSLSRQLSSICLEKLAIIWFISVVQKVENFLDKVFFCVFLKCEFESWLLNSSYTFKTSKFHQYNDWFLIYFCSKLRMFSTWGTIGTLTLLQLFHIRFTLHNFMFRYS